MCLSPKLLMAGATENYSQVTGGNQRLVTICQTGDNMLGHRVGSQTDSWTRDSVWRIFEYIRILEYFLPNTRYSIRILKFSPSTIYRYSNKCCTLFEYLYAYSLFPLFEALFEKYSMISFKYEYFQYSYLYSIKNQQTNRFVLN